MTTILTRGTPRKIKRIRFVRVLGFRRRRSWSAPFMVRVFRVVTTAVRLP
jgi:hypothetical protein